MAQAFSRARDYAHLALAGVRLFNGTMALLAPEILTRRLGRTEADGPALYAFRMFGIRTVLIAIELLLSKGGARTRALNLAVLIHATDTASAATAGAKGELPSRAAGMTTAISAFNMFLALIARRSRPPIGWFGR